MYSTATFGIMGTSTTPRSFVVHTLLALMATLAALGAHMSMYKMFETMEEPYHVLHVWCGRAAVLLFLGTCASGLFFLHSDNSTQRASWLHVLFEIGAAILFVGLPVTIKLGWLGLHRFFAHAIFYALGSMVLAAILCRICQELWFPEHFDGPDGMKVILEVTTLVICLLLIANDGIQLVRAGRLLDRKQEVLKRLQFPDKSTSALC